MVEITGQKHNPELHPAEQDVVSKTRGCLFTDSLPINSPPTRLFRKFGLSTVSTLKLGI